MFTNRILTLLSLVISLISLLTLTACPSSAPRALGDIENYAVYYGIGRADALARYDLVVVQPNTLTPEQLKRLKATGTRVAVYLSVGEVEPNRPWFSDGRVSEDWLLGVNEAWGSYYIDANRAGWRELVTEVAGDYLAQGFDGFFLDTVDTALIFPDTEDGILKLIRDLRGSYPNAVIIQNRGLPLAERTAQYVDALMFENISTSYDFANESYEYADFSFDARELQQVAEQTGLTILALDYASPDNPAMAYRATKTAEGFGFIPSVSTILLDELPDYGLIGGSPADLRVLGLAASSTDAVIEVNLENAGLSPAALTTVSLSVNGQEIATAEFESFGIGERKTWIVDWANPLPEASVEATVYGDTDVTPVNNIATLNYRLDALAEEPLLPPGEQRRREDIPQLVALPVTGLLSIDGDLADWSAASCNKLGAADQITYGEAANWQGEHDLSAVACFLWDQDNLYLSVDVTDDVLEQQFSGVDLWHGDHVELWVDTQLQLDFDSQHESADDFQLGFSPGNFDAVAPDIFIWTPPTPPEGYGSRIEYASRRTTTGYTVEARLPKLVLKGLRLEPQHAFGLTVAVSDTDTPGSAQQETILASSPKLLWGAPNTFNTLVLKDNRRAENTD